MSKLVISMGSNFTRVMESIDGFRQKYGRWPTQLVLGKDILYYLKNENLTEEGYKKFSEKFQIIEGNDFDIIAKGLDNKYFDYACEGWDMPKDDDFQYSHVILGFVE